MGTLPLHPAIVHLPLGLALVLPLVATVVILGIWMGLLQRRAFSLVVALQALLVFGAYAASQAGARDARRLEDQLGAAPIRAHQRHAEDLVLTATVVLLGATAALALPARAARAVAAAATAGSFLVAGLAVRAGREGAGLSARRDVQVIRSGGSPDAGAAVPARLTEDRD